MKVGAEPNPATRLAGPWWQSAPATSSKRLPRRLRRIEKVLLGLEGFLALSALGGGINYVLNPQQGEQGIPEVLQGTPFDSFRLPGIALLTSVALPPMIAIVGTLCRRRWAEPAHVVVGGILMGWIVVQVAFIGFGSWLPLQAFCFALGLAIAILGVRNRRDAPAGVLTRP